MPAGIAIDLLIIGHRRRDLPIQPVPRFLCEPLPQLGVLLLQIP
jgi:hypothetical protein